MVAEGVETKQQFDFLRQNDCQLMQGYYFSRPVDFDEILLLLRDQQTDNSLSLLPNRAR